MKWLIVSAALILFASEVRHSLAAHHGDGEASLETQAVRALSERLEQGQLVQQFRQNDSRIEKLFREASDDPR